MRAVCVVLVHELLDATLQGWQRSWPGTFVQPLLHRLLDTFDLPAGLRMAGARVLLAHPETGQLLPMSRDMPCLCPETGHHRLHFESVC